MTVSFVPSTMDGDMLRMHVDRKRNVKFHLPRIGKTVMFTRQLYLDAIGDIPPNMYVCHVNKQVLDNRLSNLALKSIHAAAGSHGILR